MKTRKVGWVMLVGVLLAACAKDTIAPGSEADEIALANALTTTAQAAMTERGAAPGGLLDRLIQAVRESGNAEAIAVLDEAQAQRRRAEAQGDRELAEAARTRTLLAIVMALPNSPARVGGLVDNALARIAERLNGRAAPERVQRVIDRVTRLHRAATQALAELETAGASPERLRVRALSLNLEAVAILDRLVDHVRNPGEGTQPDRQPGR